MGGSFNLFPTQASTMAGRVDGLYFYMLAVSAFFLVLVAALVIVFAVKYRRRAHDEVGANIHGSTALEVVWTAIPLLIALSMFVWGTNVYFAMAKPPADAMEIYVIGKRWMWKAQHLTGQREINELHVPVGQPIKLLIASEDVIHSYFVPAFRTKMDAVPGRTTSMWFEVQEPGEYHLFCAEYCGTQHSGMIGRIVAMSQHDFQEWLATGGTQPTQATLPEAGEQLFTQLGCVTCHRADSAGRGPDLTGVFGSTVQLANGETVIADEAYLRESILNPTARMVAGYPPLMPTYQGQVSEEGIAALIAYIKSLSGGAAATAASAAPVAADASN
jgi:cytochrome c oxidase subunit 2